MNLLLLLRFKNKERVQGLQQRALLALAAWMTEGLQIHGTCCGLRDKQDRQKMRVR